MRTVNATVVLLSLLWVTVSAGAAQPLSPLVAEWDQYFSVQSQPALGDGRSVGSGVIWNTSGWGARRIQLLVEAVDGSGQATDQRVVWLGADLPAGAHAYFETPLPASATPLPASATPLPASASYRVRVFAFNLENTGGPR
jgi:hypothetical protein